MRTKSGDRKQTVGCPGPGLAGRLQGRDYRGACDNVGGWPHSLSWWWWCFHGCLHMSQWVKLLTLNTCSFLFVNYTSLKLFNNQEGSCKVGGYDRKRCAGSFRDAEKLCSWTCVHVTQLSSLQPIKLNMTLSILSTFFCDWYISHF